MIVFNVQFVFYESEGKVGHPRQRIDVATIPSASVVLNHLRWNTLGLELNGWKQFLEKIEHLECKFFFF